MSSQNVFTKCLHKMTHLKLCRYLSPPRSQVSMMMVMMVMVMMVVVEMVAHIRVAQHALGPITAIASIRGHCGRPRWNPGSKKVTSSTAGIAQWLGPLGIGCPLFPPNVFLFFGNKEKKHGRTSCIPNFAIISARCWGQGMVFSGQQPSGSADAAGAGRGWSQNATEKQQMQPLMICGWTSYLE